MKHLLAIPIALFFLMQLSLAQKNSITGTYPVYTGTDMGYTYSKTNTRIRVYAPTAQELRLNLYKEGMGPNLIRSLLFTKDKNCKQGYTCRYKVGVIQHPERSYTKEQISYRTTANGSYQSNDISAKPINLFAGSQPDSAHSEGKGSGESQYYSKVNGQENCCLLLL